MIPHSSFSLLTGFKKTIGDGWQLSSNKRIRDRLQILRKQQCMHLVQPSSLLTAFITTYNLENMSKRTPTDRFTNIFALFFVLSKKFYLSGMETQ